MPYIPKAHEKYNLLPFSTKNGGEVFEYPGILVDISNLLPEKESIYPYGYNSYEEYYDFLDSIIEKYGNHINKLGERIQILIQKTKDLNIKEKWAVARYIGEKTDLVFGLTPGQCYYITNKNPKDDYLNIIDDEEFTPYVYGANPKDWQILEDPSGIVKQILK